MAPPSPLTRISHEMDIFMATSQQRHPIDKSPPKPNPRPHQQPPPPPPPPTRKPNSPKSIRRAKIRRKDKRTSIPVFTYFLARNRNQNTASSPRLHRRQQQQQQQLNNDDNDAPRSSSSSYLLPSPTPQALGEARAEFDAGSRYLRESQGVVDRGIGGRKVKLSVDVGVSVGSCVQRIRRLKGGWKRGGGEEGQSAGRDVDDRTGNASNDTGDDDNDDGRSGKGKEAVSSMSAVTTPVAVSVPNVSSPHRLSIPVNVDPDPDDTDRLIHLHSLLLSLQDSNFIASLGTDMSRKELAEVFAWFSAVELAGNLGIAVNDTEMRDERKKVELVARAKTRKRVHWGPIFIFLLPAKGLGFQSQYKTGMRPRGMKLEAAHEKVREPIEGDLIEFD